jgi:hypothetical protein
VEASRKASEKSTSSRMRTSSVAEDGVCLHGVEEEAAPADSAAGTLRAPAPPAEDREDEDEVGRMAAKVEELWWQGNARSMPGRGGGLISRPRPGGLNRDRIRCVPCSFLLPALRAGLSHYPFSFWGDSL